MGTTRLTIRISPRRPLWRRSRLVVLVLAVAAVGWGVIRLGHWLVVSDPLEQARAVVVLNGHFPVRAMEAASTYRERWAPEVWLTQFPADARQAALVRLGVEVDTGTTFNRKVLERLGVPPGAIRVLSEGVSNTAEEVRVIARELRRTGGERVIIVTSKAHTRRVRVTWQALMGPSLQAIIRYAREDPYDPDLWWRRAGDVRVVSRELFGLLNVWAGFPVRPGAR